MSDTVLVLGMMLLLYGIYAVGYYVGVDSERRRQRRERRGGPKPPVHPNCRCVIQPIDSEAIEPRE